MSHGDLGMHQRITRRDFLNGVALAAGGGLVVPLDGVTWLAGDANTALDAGGSAAAGAYYPPRQP